MSLHKYKLRSATLATSSICCQVELPLGDFGGAGLFPLRLAAQGARRCVCGGRMRARLVACLTVAVALPAQARRTGAQHHDLLVELLREGPPASLENSMYQRYKDYLADGTEPGDAAVIEAWGRPGGSRRRTQGALYEALELAEASMEEVQGWSSEDHLHEFVDEEVARRHEGSDWDGGCDDPLASSSAPDGACVYTCSHLVEHYYGSQDAATRCFLYDSTSGWPAELIDLKRDRLDIYAYPQTAVNDTIVFTVGKGRNCSNITFVTTTFASTGHEPVEVSERFCLFDGEHEYHHTVEDTHSLDVVGYASSGVQQGAGNTTAFVIGSCTDVLLRVTTTGGSAPIIWSLNDEFHNGPWTLETTGLGVVEHPSCMFDNGARPSLPSRSRARISHLVSSANRAVPSWRAIPAVQCSL